ncbi:Putative phage tail protein [Bryocella elongata]|uniref:Putative phage tail protein n=1 Tax=Bryocella elongata TaxID=863522 RepID=A0A1H6B6M8_9BACT|nr:phage tail protein [Bryocella elongata]SEG56513.1 Putative phage tail protein [Bryocella elongata]
MAFLGLGSRSQQPNRLGTIQVGTSEYGVAIPIGWGRFKAPIKLLDFADFSSQEVTQGGKGGGGNFDYEYYAAVDALICHGPIDTFGDVYDGGGASSLVGATEEFTIPSGGGTYQVTNGGYGDDAFYYDEGVTYAKDYSLTANDFGSDGSVTVTGNQPAPMAYTGGSPSALQYTHSNTGLYTFAAADEGKTVSITYAYTTADLSNINTGPGTNSPLSPLQRYAITAILGSDAGTPWGYMVSKYPTRALAYAGIARLVCSSMDLGTGATVPSLSVEVINGRGKAFGSGVADCDPAVVIADFLTDAKAGCNWPYLGDLTVLSNFYVANNLFVSPFLDSARKALSFLQEICDLTNAAPVWSGSQLKIIPYGDTSATANGRTFTPPTQPVYEIDESEFLCEPGKNALEIPDTDLADNYNRVTWQFSAANDNYNTQIIHEQDEASILTNTLLPMKTVNAEMYRVQLYAAIAMNMMLRRQSVALRKYQFKLPWYYQLLEPMDIIVANLTTGNLGATPMRIVSVEEDEDDELAIIAEDFLYGVAGGVQYPKGATGGNQPGAHDLPGATQLLAAFQPNTRLTGGSDQLWLALTGGTSWGGCRVWLSKDGNSYAEIAKQYGSSRAGVLTNALAAGSDPDTTNTASISTSGTLSSGSQADADAFATLALIGSELISYETATLTGSTATTNNYDLGTYLRRGIFAGNSQAHSAGEVFVRLDDAITKYSVDPVLQGQVIYLKFTSWNLYGNEEQDLANVQAYPINLGASASTATNVTVRSFANSGGTTATVAVYKSGGALTDGGTGTLANGASVTLPAQSWATEALGTWYGINFNPATSAYVIYTDRNAWLADQLTMLAIGSTTTPASGATALLPDDYDDVGSQPTTNPQGAWLSGQTAGISGSAFTAPLYDVDGGSESNASINYYGWAGTTTAAKTLSLTAAFTAVGGAGYMPITYTLDGSTWSTLVAQTSTTASASYSASVPSGTDLSNVVVSISAFSATPAAGHTSSARITVSNLQIA